MRRDGWRQYLDGEVEPLLAVSLVVESFFESEASPLLHFVADHVEFLLLVPGHHAEGQLAVFPHVSVLGPQLQDLGTNKSLQ